MKLRALAVAVALSLGMVVGASLATTDTYAEACPTGSLRSEYVNSLAECNIPVTEDSKPGLMDRAVQIINVIVGVVGLLAVVVIVIGAILFVTSTGEAAKTTRARNTILYGVVGLVISLLAFTIVNFVLGAVFSKNTGSGDGSGDSGSDSSEQSTGDN